MPERAIDIGKQAEDCALAYLQHEGLQLIERNFYCKLGEIDLIMLDKGSYVFIEVKYRKQLGYGSPVEAVTLSKQKKLWKTAQVYLQRHKLTDQVACRFDVIGMTGGKENQYQWIKNAFMA